MTRDELYRTFPRDTRRPTRGRRLAALACVGFVAAVAWQLDEPADWPTEPAGMVHCQEDEYLYPRDYKGESAGGNQPADLMCVHVDQITSN